MNKERLYQIIFEADTKEGKFFDVVLILSVILNTTLILLESVESFRLIYGNAIKRGETFFLFVFLTISKIRIIVVKPIKLQ